MKIDNQKTLKKHYIIGAFSLLVWAMTFITDTKIFTSDGLNMNCLPIDLSMVLPMHILTKILVLLFIFGLFEFLLYAFKRPSLLIPFLGFLLIYVIGLLITYPGYYMSDDPIIFAYATRYYPVYWHHYLTSLFYMMSISLFPASCAPVLISDILYAFVYAYIFYRSRKNYNPKCCYLLLIAGILPFTLLGALMCFRPAVYSSFFLFYFIYLFFEWKEKAACSIPKLILLSFMTALLSVWRSESIVLLPIGFILIGLTYFSKRFFTKHSLKTTFAFVILSIIFAAILQIPQKQGENKYYGKDYLIISTTRPLTVIVHRDQTYEGAETDLANINAITDFGYLHNDSLSCSAYNRYNTDHNNGLYTQTGASADLQNAYIKSALNLILHNLDLYIGERIQLFCVTNGIYNYDKNMVLNLKPVVSTDFHLYDHDRSYGFEMLDAYKRIPLTNQQGYALALFKHGGEAYIPMLVLLFISILLSLIRKNWFLFFSLGALLAREMVIFFTAPASFIQYSYPMMYVTAAYLLLLLVEQIGKKINK